jgi:hypothetical protein
MVKNIGVLAAAALAIAAFAFAPSTATAQSFSGSYLLTWNITVGFAGTHTYCLTLTDNGSGGFPHSGPATVTGNYVIDPSAEGSFAVINNELVVTFYIPGGEAEVGEVTFVAPANKGNIGDGFGEYGAAGAFTDLGTLTVGKAGSCANDAKEENSKEEQPRPRSSNSASAKRG